MVSAFLDTNSVIAYINGDSGAAKIIELIPELLLPAIVIGEMAYGAQESAHRDNNLKLLKEFSSICTIVHCGEEAAYEYGQIKSNLKKKGKKIPENDMWIAACAKHANLPLISRDSHFDFVDELQRISW